MLTEYEVASYILHHKEGLTPIFDSLNKEAEQNPDLSDYYKDARLEEIRQYLATQLNASYADVAAIVEEGFLQKWLTT